MNLVSKEGERWDSLCQRAYGHTSQVALDALRAANVAAARASTGFVLPTGYVITVPTLPETSASTVVVEVAPWQR